MVTSIEKKTGRAILYFTLKKAQDAIRINSRNLTDEQLQKHIVKLRDYKGYIDRQDFRRLAEGGYYAKVVDPSATGVVPKDIWLQTNLGQGLDEAIREKQTRISNIIKQSPRLLGRKAPRITPKRPKLKR